jgi:hypothetical protein
VRGESAALFGRHHLVRLRDDERRREQAHPGMPSSRAARRKTRRLGARSRTRRISATRRRRLAVDELVENALLERASASMLVALEHQLQRVLRADQARQTLRSAGTRQSGPA